MEMHPCMFAYTHGSVIYCVHMWLYVYLNLSTFQTSAKEPGPLISSDEWLER